ncbi:hypothetical protein CDL15_Pgr024405 [Punica granatum]|uniref:Uncharacterized protein n=1 Tax=Punica granatum TaxID=22663 RepID=A0A218XX72_PUNGR|nr:hypothetical protein CDL15_Pgr024405 [Punica granatum]
MEALKVDKLACPKKQVVDRPLKLVESAGGRREKSDWKDGKIRVHPTGKKEERAGGRGFRVWPSACFLARAWGLNWA